MRLYSTPQSFRDREVSALALLESTIALCGTLYLAYRGYWIYLGAMALLTPLLLLRTPESTSKAIDWYINGIEKFLDLNVVVYAMGPLFVILWAPAVKIAATAVFLARAPLRSLGAIPDNWTGQVFCLDFAHPPEFVPGLELHPTFTFRVGKVLEGLKDRSIDTWVRVLFAIMFIPSLGVALLYRLSVKGTALVWLPLVWISLKLKPKESFKVRLEEINATSLGHLIMFFAVLTLLAFFAKIFVYNELLQISEQWFKGDLGRLLHDYIAPTTLPWWQIASVTNAVFALVLYFWASVQRVRLGDASFAADTRGPETFLTATTVFRSIVSVYTIACLLYLAVARMQLIRLPPIGEHVVPWAQ